MIGNFKLVRRISFNLPGYSSVPLTFENVYVDRFNSIFKGFYLLVGAQDVNIYNIENQNQVVFTKIRSTERFGSGLGASDVLSVNIVESNQLMGEELRIINYLNTCVEKNFYRVSE